MAQCRICTSNQLEQVIDLGNQVITSRFPVYGDTSTPTTPISLSQCRECGLVQLTSLVPQQELYEHMYGYRSGLNEMMRSHLRQYNSEIREMVTLDAGDAVLDIGSNDATFLSYYPSNVTRVGCDPTGTQFATEYAGLTLVPTYFTAEAVPKHSYKVVTSISMFYDLPDPVQFARDVRTVLHDEGIWSLEQSYIRAMLNTNSIDTICHEHVEYYAVRQIKRIMDEAGMKIIRISENGCNGGSFRIYAAKRESNWKEDIDTVQLYLHAEEQAGLQNPDTYREFVARCDREIATLKEFLATHPNTYIYGASTKGNCLLQYANIGESDIRYAVERNPQKVGKMTSTGIEIIGEERMRENPPDYLLVLPWHFRDAIVQREAEFLQKGGSLIFPLPRFEIVSHHA